MADRDDITVFEQNPGIEYVGKLNPNLPFFPAVRAGDFIFVSGQVAKDENGNMSTGSIEEQTRQTLRNIERILKLAGASLADVVKVTTFLEDPRDFQRYNRAYAEFFPHGKPARSTVEARIMIDTRIEIEAIAYAPQKTA